MLKSIARLSLSIPWCCVLTVAVSVLSVGNIGLSWMADSIIHWLIPLSFAIHGWIGYRLYRHMCGHRTGELKIFWASMVLLMAATLFHFTPWHDQLLGK